MVSGLGVTELVSWGVLVYAFSVLVVPMRAELGWTTAVLNGAYATGVVISGLLAIPVGRLLQAYGARGVMSLGTVATVATLVLWSLCTRRRRSSGSSPSARWRWRRRCTSRFSPSPLHGLTGTGPRPLVLTVFGSLASVVFVPLTAALTGALGWRSALMVLAAIAAIVGLPVHTLLIRRHPADLGLHPDGAAQPLRRSLTTSPGQPDRFSPSRLSGG